MIDAGEHLGLVYRIAGELYPLDGIEADDVLGAGAVGLVQAARRFDAARGLAFTTFAAPRIRGAVLDYLRRRWGRSRRRPEEVPGIPRTIPDPRGGEERILAKIEARQYLRRLDDRERDVIVRYFWRGEELEEIGAALGVTCSRVCQIKNAALRRLRGE